MAAMKVAIRETRGRLAMRLARTADHVHLLFTTPSSASQASQKRAAAVSSAVQSRRSLVAGRTKRVWTDAKETGLLRRVVIGGVVVAMAAALATRTRRR